MTLEVTINGTTVAHTLITNGALTTLGPNHWSVAFPDHTTALSTLLEVLAAADEFRSQTTTSIALPTGGSDNHRGGAGSDHEQRTLDLRAAPN